MGEYCASCFAGSFNVVSAALLGYCFSLRNAVALPRNIRIQLPKKKKKNGGRSPFFCFLFPPLSLRARFYAFTLCSLYIFLLMASVFYFVRCDHVPCLCLVLSLFSVHVFACFVCERDRLVSFFFFFLSSCFYVLFCNFGVRCCLNGSFDLSLQRLHLIALHPYAGSLFFFFCFCCFTTIFFAAVVFTYTQFDWTVEP